MLCHPGDADPNRPQHPDNLSYDDLSYGQTEADNPLVANLPTKEFLDIKSRVCDGKMQFLTLTRLQRDLLQTYFVDPFQ